MLLDYWISDQWCGKAGNQTIDYWWSEQERLSMPSSDAYTFITKRLIVTFVTCRVDWNDRVYSTVNKIGILKGQQVT